MFQNFRDDLHFTFFDEQLIAFDIENDTYNIFF